MEAKEEIEITNWINNNYKIHKWKTTEMIYQYHQAKLKEINPCNKFDCSNPFFINQFENR